MNFAFLNHGKTSFVQQNSLPSIPSLVRLQLSSTSLSRIPPELGRLTYLHLDDNPLLQLTAEDLKVLDGVRRVSLTGNSSGFMCDCGVPSPLQLWLREKRNREKVQDVDSITCYLPLFGAVPILSTLPGNESLCREGSVETTKWTDFVTNMEQHSSDDPNKVISQMLAHSSDSLCVLSKIFRSPFTTKIKNIYKNLRNFPIFILFICIVVLVVTIAFTLYYRYATLESLSSSQKSRFRPDTISRRSGARVLDD
ncbi:unnamed protein product [Nippostrongylus brasiliensis]|uniref:LRRCT domain-containing protein n=1 Tax=Nippostrongylus brasiliensis TaxID=27835 RepID=A0A0N4XCL6_NIPBR|nr:unnamed protein product [Nippostrongylus brasiliensis]